MKLISIEPTPSPNTMKLNLDETLPNDETHNFKAADQNDDAPAYARELLAIDGVKGLYHVADFIAIERNGKVKWETILPEARRILGETNHQEIETEHETTEQPGEALGEVKVYIQKFRDIPMQIKLVENDEEKRVGLPQRFMEAAMEAGKASENLVMERQWVEESPRYGDLTEIGEEVAEEMSAAYDDERLNEMVARVLSGEVKANGQQKNNTSEQPQLTLEDLDHPDWRKRYAALEQIDPTEDDIPALDKALDDEKMSIRRLATVYLGMIEKPIVLQYLYKALKDKSVTVRRTAGDCLSDLGDPAAIPAAIEALQDPSKIVRWRAAMFLYEVGDTSAIDALRQAQDDPEFEVAMQAKMALKRIEGGKQAEGSVWQQMTDAINENK